MFYRLVLTLICIVFSSNSAIGQSRLQTGVYKFSGDMPSIKEKYSKFTGPLTETQILGSEHRPPDAFSESLPETEIDPEEILDPSLVISSGTDKSEALEEDAGPIPDEITSQEVPQVSATPFNV